MDLFQDFLAGSDTLRIYHDGKLVFSSEKERLIPIMEYIATTGSGNRPAAVIFDKIGGNAAALLAIKANCCELYSPLGSELAVKTLQKYGIKYHFKETVPYIKHQDGKRMCPMEQLSIDKEPEEFYQEIKDRMESQKAEGAGIKEATWTR